MPNKQNNENQELLNLIGDDAFTRLCTVFFGTLLHVSNSDRSRKRLNIIVGAANAEKMIFNFDGTALTLPMLSSFEIKKRHQAIIEDREIVTGKDFENALAKLGRKEVMHDPSELYV